MPGYNVRAVPLPDAERDRNLDMLRFISEETERRGLHFQLGLWTHAYKWTDSPHANYLIEGLTPETQASYCRDALRTVLQACPSIRGVTIRTHGESGVPKANMVFGKKSSTASPSVDGVLGLTCTPKAWTGNDRRGTGHRYAGDVSPKFWAEHIGLPYMQGAIRPLGNAAGGGARHTDPALSTGSRSFMRYGYGDLLIENRRYGVVHRIWPGTQRMLLWGT